MELHGNSRAAARPVPQPYGVSHEGAEALIRDWMRYLGALDADITRYSQDGGIDVFSETFVAQVKNYKGSVSVQEVRELYGVAQAENKTGLLFTSGSVTPDGIEFANRVRIPLIRYCAEDATIAGMNSLGDEIVARGLPGTSAADDARAGQAAAEQADELARDLLKMRRYSLSTVQEWLDIIDGLLTKYERRQGFNLASALDEDFHAIDRLLATRITDDGTQQRVESLKQRQRRLLGRPNVGHQRPGEGPGSTGADVGDERLARHRADVAAAEQASKRGYTISTQQEWLDMLGRLLTSYEQLGRRERRKLKAEVREDLTTMEGTLFISPHETHVKLQLEELKKRAR